MLSSHLLHLRLFFGEDSLRQSLVNIPKPKCPYISPSRLDAQPRFPHWGIGKLVATFLRVCQPHSGRDGGLMIMLPQ